jgi:membrane associated rhomboid family serine protease
MIVSILVLILATVIISYKGIQDSLFFRKNEFHIGSIQAGEQFRMLSSGFLHADFQHLFFNMFTLYLFAPYVVFHFGNFYFFVLYFGSLIAGSLLTLYFHKSEYQYRAVGASGAIYGLLVAFAFMAPNAELGLMFIPIPIKAKYFVPGLLAIDLFMGVSGESIFGGASGIAHFAHIGGALVGFLMVWYWKKNEFNRHRWH